MRIRPGLNDPPAVPGEYLAGYRSERAVPVAGQEAAFLPVIYHVADQVFTFPAFLAGGTLVTGRRPAPGPGQAPTEADLIAFCHDRLVGFETPKRVLFAGALPETVGGKVLKYKLRETYADAYR